MRVTPPHPLAHPPMSHVDSSLNSGLSPCSALVVCGSRPPPPPPGTPTHEPCGLVLKLGVEAMQRLGRVRVPVAGETVVHVGPALGCAVGGGHEAAAGGDNHLDVGGVLGLDRCLRESGGGELHTAASGGNSLLMRLGRCCNFHTTTFPVHQPCQPCTGTYYTFHHTTHRLHSDEGGVRDVRLRGALGAEPLLVLLDQ